MKILKWLCLGAVGTLAAQEGLPVSELWMRQFPGVQVNADFDSDGDGFSDFEEGVATTDPFDPDSFLFLEAAFSAETGLVDFSWEGEIGKLYLIEVLSEGNWQTLAGSIAREGEPQALSLAADGTLIARLVVRDIDHDQDGVNRWEEGLLGWSDEDPRSAGTDVHDYAALFGMLEGEGTVSLAGGTISIPKTKPSIAETSLFLSQASFGGNREMISAVRDTGLVPWLDTQLAMEEMSLTEELLFSEDDVRDVFTWSKTWWGTVMRSEDQLRLRMAYALSQIFVISGAGSDPIRGGVELQAHYYDLLVKNALGNYRNLLEDVAFSTQMGVYLSHLWNDKGDPENSIFPDENFAREIMQLFSIGLWKLHPDGREMLDAEGNPISTYDNEVITEMAKIFTGLGLGSPLSKSFYYYLPASEWNYPMKLYDEHHSQGEKVLFDGVVVPEGQSAAEDIAMTIEALSAHGNVAPFIGHLLIQRFTGSDPSPAYRRRVSEVWVDNGSGVRGDLKAVLRAILLDPEVRHPSLRRGGTGKVREPILRLASVLRFFNAKNQQDPPTYPMVMNYFDLSIGQRPLYAPSVFNFYQSDYRPLEVPGGGDIFAPELQLATSNRLVNMDNFLEGLVRVGINPAFLPEEKVIRLDFQLESEWAGNGFPSILDNLNQFLAGGRLSETSLQIIEMAVEEQSLEDLKLQTAIHLILDSPEFVTYK
ncbi:DUF1800 family protein [bacterium]|nr:DUF1800 family protein [bacterium]MDB4754151.1 DUF1800 family protein [Akkermansiaceae bacterium]